MAGCSSAAESAASAVSARPRWYVPTIGKYLVLMLSLQVGLRLSQHFQWFWFNERKGYTVLITVAATAMALSGLVAFVLVSRFFKGRIVRGAAQFSLATLLLMVPVMGIPCAWLAREMQIARRQREFIASRMVSHGYHDEQALSQTIRQALPKAITKVWDRNGEQALLQTHDWLESKLGESFFADLKVANLSEATDADLETLGTLPKLKAVWLTGSKKVTDTGFAQLSRSGALQRLDLTKTSISDAGLAHLAGLKELDFLGLEQTQITDAGLQHLAGHARLQCIELSESNVTDAGLAYLKTLPRLDELYLGRTGITDAGLAHLKDLTQLRKLHLSQTGITDEGLAHLSALAHLQSLRLGGTSVTGTGLQHLAGLPQLEVLSLRGAQVTDAGLEHLNGLTHLQRLSLEDTRVGDAGVEHLKGLSELRYLMLQRTSVTDAGLEQLTGLTRLEELFLYGTGGTEEGVAKLQRALQKCKIVKIECM